MTGLLEEALRRVQSLPPEQQDVIASDIIAALDSEALDDEAAWSLSLRENPAPLRSMAREAMEEHRRGETRPIDELLR